MSSQSQVPFSNEQPKNPELVSFSARIEKQFDSFLLRNRLQ